MPFLEYAFVTFRLEICCFEGCGSYSDNACWALMAI